MIKRISNQLILVFLFLLLSYSYPSSTLAAAKKAYSRAVYNPDKNQFLLVWADARNHSNPDGADCYKSSGCNNDIYGMIVDQNLYQVGADFPIVRTPNDETYPEVVYNSINKEYLVVYQRNDGGDQLYNVYATRLRDTGQVIQAIPIAQDRADQWEPTVVFNSIDNQYMIAYMGHFYEAPDDGAKDIKVQLMSGAGGKIGEPHFISVDEAGLRLPGKQERPVIAFMPSNKSYMVVWEDELKLALGGTILDSQGFIAISPKTFLIEEGTGRKFYPQIALKSFNQEVMLIWQNNKTGVKAVEALRLKYSGERIGNLIIVDSRAATDTGNPRPAMTCDPRNGSCLVTRMDWVNYQFRLQFFDKNGVKVGNETVFGGDGSRSTIVFNEKDRYFLVIRTREPFNLTRINALPAEFNGDLNQDGRVDEIDLTILLKNWGNPWVSSDLQNLLLDWSTQ